MTHEEIKNLPDEPVVFVDSVVLRPWTAKHPVNPAPRKQSGLIPVRKVLMSFAGHARELR